MTTVYYGIYHNSDSLNALSLLFMKPEPLLPEIIKTRDVTHDSHFTKCPAFQSYYKNTYVVRCPIDITIKYDKATGNLSIFPQTQEFYNKRVTHRGHQIGASDSFCMSLELDYLFIADEECIMEQLPVTFHSTVNTNNIRLINGCFDIGNWYRPLQFSFEMTGDTVVFKRGDPLFYVRFLPKHTSKVELIERTYTKDELDGVNMCVTVKDAQPKLSLDILYALAKKLAFKKMLSKKKCPLSRWIK